MNQSKPASFVERLGALVIDLFIISLVTSILSIFIVNNDNYTKLSNEYSEITEKYMNGKIEPVTYINKAADISYDLSRETAGLSIITIAIYILYFMVYQFKKNGQTIGKRILKIRVISNNSKSININDFVIRSLLINSVLADLIILSVTILGTKNLYFTSSMIVQFIDYGIIFSSAIMILTRKDKRGIHDIITNTKVIKEI